MIYWTIFLCCQIRNSLIPTVDQNNYCQQNAKTVKSDTACKIKSKKGRISKRRDMKIHLGSDSDSNTDFRADNTPTQYYIRDL